MTKTIRCEIIKLLTKNKLSFTYNKYKDENDDIMLRIKIYNEDNDFIDPYTHNTVMFMRVNDNDYIVFDYIAKSKEELVDMIKIQDDINKILKREM